MSLTIARDILAAHGGTLTVESAPDAGATFTVRLPLRWDTDTCTCTNRQVQCKVLTRIQHKYERGELDGLETCERRA